MIGPEDLAAFPDSRELTPEERAQVYALSKAKFTAADLQKFAEEEDGLPLEDLIKELEEAQREIDRGSHDQPG